MSIQLLSEPFSSQSTATAVNTVVTAGQTWRVSGKSNGDENDNAGAGDFLAVNAGHYVYASGDPGFGGARNGIWGGTLTLPTLFSVKFTANFVANGQVSLLCAVPQAVYRDTAGCAVRIVQTGIAGYESYDQNGGNLAFNFTAFIGTAFTINTDFAFELQIQNTAAGFATITLLCGGTTLFTQALTHFSTGTGVGLSTKMTTSGTANGIKLFVVDRPEVAPGVPTSVTASYNLATRNIDVAWTAPATGDPVVSYEIFASTGGAYASVGTSPTNSFTHTGVQASATYTYKVTATNGGGTSAQSTASGGAVVPSPSSPGRSILKAFANWLQWQ